MAFVVEREPRYGRRRVTLRKPMPLAVDLPFPVDFIAFIDVSQVDPAKVYVAFNEPSVFIPISKVIVADTKQPIVRRLLFTWDESQEGKQIEFYYAGAPGLRIGVTTVSIGGDYVGLAKETTLSSILSKLDVALSTRASEGTLSSILSQLDVTLSTRASEDTLTSINTKLSQPTSLRSEDVTIDNSAGTDPVVQALFATSTPSRYATIYRDPADTGTVYVGDSSKQVFPFNPGDKIETQVSDLSMIYIRVPAGVVANIHVLWEV